MDTGVIIGAIILAVVVYALLKKNKASKKYQDFKAKQRKYKREVIKIDKEIADGVKRMHKAK